ncbi:DUF6773 family protein [Streptococcus himalayensis]|uniref:Uncharacterized protein n=1 Tax=Streptococcus himalayensis TaxID=1888195 RepID=A0A917A475_9STRE|nr:DUF6773 family protein [Streptococcus himalayensis]GGE26173.1 hypothetical protein GCM10011510_04150 [Streptococcus himalayensis]
MKVKKALVDERVIGLEHQIMAEIGTILLVLLPVSALIKSAILHQPFERYSFESIAGLVALIYAIIRYVMKGLDMTRGTNVWLSGLGMALLTTVICSWNNYQTYGSHYHGLMDGHFWAVVLILFISSSLLVFVLYGALHLLSRYSQKKLLAQLDKDD